MKKIRKLLIANRGEIAVRILRTCKEMGIATVSVYSEADEESLHVKLADESVCIGPAKPALSYLNIPAVLSAAEITEADAIHPGFGFLSENSEFSEMCEKWGVTFVGPNRSCIERLGDKILSKTIAKEAGIPLLEPVAVNGRSDSEVISDVLEMGFPVLIKASAGGGGRGMKKITNKEELIPSIERLKAEALAGFGNDTLFIEKYIENPRHIEVQILADQNGNTIHLGERDCTVQRRFQKVIEEAPCPVIDDTIRDEICSSAIQLAKSVGYDSVGTVEFLYDLDTEKFYFMEMNTRIQVEHPVTEMVTGVDLIEQQILVATGEKLKLKQSDIKTNGHAMECRINAENPKTGAPSPGKITHYYRPAGPGVRVDDFIYSGYVVPPYYDSMVAKIITYSTDRNSCIKKMRRALEELIVKGIHINRDLLLDVIDNEDFKGNNYSTHFLNKYLS